jgi:DNA-binding response OmpR family regulator
MIGKKRILVVEDDLAILRGIKDSLEFESYETLIAEDGEEGFALAGSGKPDLVILDVMLPQMDGFTLCRRLRKDGFTAPILFLTARNEEADRIRGLDLGADDYLTKPFSLPELLARVRAILRRSSGPSGNKMTERLEIGDLVVDFMKYTARKGGRTIDLSRKEFGVLRMLASRLGEVVGRDELLDEVWGHERFPTTRTVDNHIAFLRAKIEDLPSEPRLILTVHGVGYKLAMDE